jgi:hypothetical protein
MSVADGQAQAFQGGRRRERRTGRERPRLARFLLGTAVNLVIFGGVGVILYLFIASHFTSKPEERRQPVEDVSKDVPTSPTAIDLAERRQALATAASVQASQLAVAKARQADDAVIPREVQATLS